MSNYISEKQLYKLNATAVEELIALYRAPLLHFALGFVGDVFLAEDVVSDTITKLLVKQPTLRNKDGLKTYLYKTAKHIALNYARKQKREKLYVKRELYESQKYIAYLDDKLATSEEKREVLAALQQLSPDYREVLHLHYFEDLSIADVCKVTGKRKKQIYNLLARAKTSLQKILKKEDGNDEI